MKYTGRFIKIFIIEKCTEPNNCVEWMRTSRTVTRAALVTRIAIASISANEARGCESKREAPQPR